MWAEPYNPLYVWGSCFHQIRTPFLQGGGSVQQGLSAAYEFSRLGWHRGAANKRYSLGITILHMLRRLFPAALLALPIAVWGYAFEASYFAALSLSSHDALKPWHYIASGGGTVLSMFVVLLVYAHLSKFFSRRIHQDDMKEVRAELKKADFKSEILGARIAMLLSLAFWLMVYFGHAIPALSTLSSLFLYLTFVNVGLFFGCIATSPNHSRFTVLFMLVLSIALCFAAGGYGAGKQDLSRSSPLRDDYIVKIVRMNGTISAHATELVLPTSWWEGAKQLLGVSP